MDNLPKVISKRKKRVGRGIGSGKGGHTVGRGQKGQKARGSVGVLFEGVKLKKSLLRRLPLLRGKAKMKPYPKPFVVKLSNLNKLENGSEVTTDLLIKAGLVPSSAKFYGVKIVSHGEITKKLNIKLPISASAATQVQSAGGTIK